MARGPKNTKMSYGLKTPRKQGKTGGPKKNQKVIRGKTALVQTHPECLVYKSESGCRFREKCSSTHHQVEEQPSKRCKKNGAVAKLKITRQLGCVSQDMEPPKSSSIMRKSSNILKPIRCVRFTKAVARHADMGDQNPSLGLVC